MDMPERVYATGNNETGSWNKATATFSGPVEVEYIRADLVPQWQPIETAPKDGGPFDIWADGLGRIPNVRNYRAYACATHWMPLPKAPTT